MPVWIGVSKSNDLAASKTHHSWLKVGDVLVREPKPSHAKTRHPETSGRFEERGDTFVLVLLSLSPGNKQGQRRKFDQTKCGRSRPYVGVRGN